ncbi:hypothetical protein KIH74_29855 [Kineosporia sp. J2-2]|uniref:Uncharacterized protein n=1 Tax=Kineosporia corallincola TaxID=2835133 RepID=A0ABS5TR39_9ACTN|nr:hypothetical protein [Kineosporia corallincola]MBT0773186.1 hypothetical protein [Kineosporia corallincola]
MDHNQLSARTDTWVLACLATNPAGMTLREIRVRLWDELPADVRSSWEVLVIGDQVSRSLHQLAREGVVRHDRYAMRWQAVAPEQHLPAPPTRVVPGGEQSEFSLDG